MVEVIKTYNIDVTGCPCCGIMPCVWCSFCDVTKSPKRALLTFSGFSGAFAAMNRSFTVEVGGECEPQQICLLETTWAGISGCPFIGVPLWRRVTLEVFSATRFKVTARTSNDSGDDCATDISLGDTATRMEWINATDDFTSGECGANQSVKTLAYSSGSATTITCDNSIPDTINVTGTQVTVQVLETYSIPGTLTLSFTGPCAAALGTVTLTWDAGSLTYLGSGNCSINYVFDPCAGGPGLTASGDGTITFGGFAYDDYFPISGDGTMTAVGSTCCSAGDAATTTYLISA